MASTDEVINALEGNKGQLEEFVNGLGGSKQMTEELRDTLAGLGAEGSAGTANSAVEAIESLMGEASGYADRIEEVKVLIESIRSGSLLTSATTEAPPSAASIPAARAAPVPRRLPDFDSRKLHKEAVADVRRAGYPKNAEGKTSARAFVYTSDGEQVNSTPLKAYPRGQAPERPELKEPWASSEELTTTWHVEGDAAAMIRDGNLENAAFYLNVPLCGRRAEGAEYPDPNRCFENFRHIIPEGAAAYVWVIPERGTPRRWRIVGTGKGIKNDR